jgi:hypothetical protein
MVLVTDQLVLLFNNRMDPLVLLFVLVLLGRYYKQFLLVLYVVLFRTDEHLTK